MKIISKIRHLVKKNQKKYSHFKVELKCNYEWYGNDYGGFYLCPNFLDENSIVYSFGIGEDMSFDNAVIKNHNCNVFGFDPTPKSVEWIKTQETSNKFQFYDFGISNKNGIVNFFLPKNTGHVSGSLDLQININENRKINVEVKSLSDIVDRLGHKHIDVLKMDIEGSEYDVLENILNSKIPITQILVEFHDRLFLNGHLKSKKIIEKMKNCGYQMFGISDSFEEISFINNDYL